MKIVEFNPASPSCNADSLRTRFAASYNSLVVRVDYDHPITKKAYARAFMVPEVTFLFAVLHDQTDQLITAKLGELIGLSMLREAEKRNHPEIIRWLRSKTVLVEHRSSLTDWALLVDLDKPLDFLSI